MDIDDPKYKNQLEYPARLSKPVLSAHATAAQCREHADKLEAYERSKVAHDDALLAYHAEESRVRNLFYSDLKEEMSDRFNEKQKQIILERGIAENDGSGMQNLVCCVEDAEMFAAAILDAAE